MASSLRVDFGSGTRPHQQNKSKKIDLVFHEAVLGFNSWLLRVLNLQKTTKNLYKIIS
jgi:hypothetical protein